MYRPPLDDVCTSCGGPKPKGQFRCNKKKCVEFFRSFSKGKGYIMGCYKSESGIPIHKLGSNIKLIGGMYDT
jgi:hypothetical protein